MDWRIDIPEGTAVPVREDDLAELLGNLLDNACKWAAECITVAADGGDAVTISVEDDGPGRLNRSCIVWGNAAFVSISKYPERVRASP